MRRRTRATVWAAALSATVSVALAAGTPIDGASKAQLDAAQKTFDAASDLYDAQRYEEAITAFRASHDIVASPNSRLMIARALVELGRLDEALTEYEAALAEAADAASRSDKYAKTRDAVTAELDSVRSRVGRVQLDVTGAPPGTEVTVGDAVRRATDLGRPFVVRPGKLAISARAPDGREARREIDVAAGQSVTLSLALPAVARAAPAPAPEASSPAPAPAPAEPAAAGRTLAWVAAGVGVAGFVAFGVFGAMNQATFTDLEESCRDDHCTPDRADDIDAGRTYQTLANVGAVVGVLGAGTALTLFLTSDRSGTARGRAARAPAVAVGPNGVAVRGRF